jgi:hypothetical protein
MRINDDTIVIRLLLLAILVVVWLGTWLDYEAASQHGSVGIPNEVLLAGLAMCVYAGALARLAGRRGRRTWAGAAAGAAMIASYVGGSIAIELAHGGLGPMAEGETPFSLLIELPLWLGVPFLVGAGCGVVGWLVVNALVEDESEAHAP